MHSFRHGLAKSGQIRHGNLTTDNGVGVRLKVGYLSPPLSGGINIEKIEAVGSGEGLCPPQLGVWGLAPRKKKSILRQKLCNSEQLLVLLSYITAESGGLSPSPESWGTYPPVPPAPTPMTTEGRTRA